MRTEIELQKNHRMTTPTTITESERKCAEAINNCMRCYFVEPSNYERIGMIMEFLAEHRSQQVSDLIEERDVWIFNAKELQEGYNELDKKVKELTQQRDQMREAFCFIIGHRHLNQDDPCGCYDKVKLVLTPPTGKGEK